MKTIEYLNKMFPVPFNHLKAHFFDTFGINLNDHDGLYQFKYDQIAAKWTHNITHECRGLILTNVNQKWRIVARPWTKFFTYGQSQCPITESNIVAELPFLEWRQKCDGTCIMVYHHDDVWNASTLGSIPTGNVGDFPFTFADLFWRTSGFNPENFDGLPGKTYLFELCCVENQVVTRYDINKIFYLGTIDNETGALVNIMPDYNIAVPISRKVEAKSVEEVMAFVEESSKDETFGKNPEGWVLYKNGVPVCKMKNSKYMALHHMGGGDVKCSRNRIIETIFAGSFDDVRGDLPDMLRDFGDSVIEKVGQMMIYADDLACQLKGEYPTQKDYALKVQAICNDKRFCAFFFKNKEAAIRGESIRETFISWIKDNHEKFEKDFKND